MELELLFAHLCFVIAQANCIRSGKRENRGERKQVTMHGRSLQDASRGGSCTLRCVIRRIGFNAQPCAGMGRTSFPAIGHGRRP
jgi:hypothetical protein